MKQFRKIVSAILICAILIPCVLTVNAVQEKLPISQSERLLLIEILSEIEQQKNSWGLENIDFEDIQIGPAIQSYNYVEEEIVMGHAMYPLTVNDQLVLWATPIGEQFQISNGLVSEINATVDTDTPFALIYDAKGAFLYTGESILLLRQYNHEIGSRGTLDASTRLTAQEINTVSLSQSVLLGYAAGISNRNRASGYYVCNVSYVPQNHDNICWAATVACIVNYVRGTSLDAETVAKSYFGNTNFNQGIGCDNLREKLQDYGLDYYQFSNYGPFSDKIMNSIIAGHPVGGTFVVVNGGFHATTIFGINVIAGRIQVMDPEFGSTTAWSTGDGYSYSYVSSHTNSTLNLYAVSFDPGN